MFPQSEHKPGNASMMQFLILTELPWNKCALHQEESTFGSWHKRGLLWVKHQILNIRQAFRVVNTPPKVFIQDIIRFMVSDIPSMQSNWLGTFVFVFYQEHMVKL